MTIVNSSGNRQPLSRAAMTPILLTVAGLLLPLAAMQSGGAPARGLAGFVRDVVGVVPNADVTAIHRESGTEFKTVTDSAGAYFLPDLPAGGYTVEVRKPGFELLRVGGFHLSATKGLKLDHYLQLGRIQETVTVRGEGGSRSAGATSSPSAIKVSGTVQGAKAVKMLNPSYPADAKAAGIEGTVIMRAVVSKAGKVIKLQVLASSDPDLARAAMEAVQQWEYTPTLLNGEPVEVVTDVVVNFTLSS